DAVLDGIVHHLHEVARTGGPAMQVTLLGHASRAAPRCRCRRIAAGSQGLQQRFDAFKTFARASCHEAIPPLQAPYTTAGADIDIHDSLRRKLRRASHVVLPE